MSIARPAPPAGKAEKRSRSWLPAKQVAEARSERSRQRCRPGSMRIRKRPEAGGRCLSEVVSSSIAE